MPHLSSASDVDLIDDVRSNNINKLSKHEEINKEKEIVQRRQKYFRETIHIVLKHGGGMKDNENDQLIDEETKLEGQQTKEWYIQRIRLNPDFLQQLVDRLLHSTDESGAIIAYLKEVETGQIILPNDMQSLCQAYVASTDRIRQLKMARRSCSYELFLSLPNKTKDVMDTNDGSIQSYKGQMKFVLHGVPLLSQNSLHQVKPVHVKNWIVDGILQEDVDVRKTETIIKNIMKALEVKRKELERVSEEPMLNERGHQLSGKKAQMKREERYEFIQREKDELHVQYDEAMDDLQDTRKNVVKKICLKVIQHDNKTTWEFAFHGKSREYFDDLIVKKGNWNTSYMYADPDVDLLSGNYYSVPDREYLVDSAGISIERLEHGFGCFHKRAPCDPCSFKNSTDSHIYAYHGTYHNGGKNGYGILFSGDGIYGGPMEENKPSGSGIFITKDGDIFRSNFEAPTHSSQQGRINRYLRSVPHGKCTVQFSDGAYYEGEIEQGVIHGRGTYISLNGEIQEGKFFHGTLVQGKKVTSSGDSFCGYFEDGSLNGEGITESKSTRCVRKGYFIDGSIHGVGEEIIYAKNNTVLSKYSGLFCNGRRSGLGCLDFRDVGFKNDQSNLSKDDLCQRGYWIAGQPKPGGMIMKKANNFAEPTTHSPSSRFQWLSRLKKVEEKKMAVQHRNDQRQHIIAQAFHSEIEAKKRLMFDRQESFMKAILCGVKGANKQYQQVRENRHKALPSNSKYFSQQRKINKAPSSIEEAMQIAKPGLQMTTIGYQHQNGLFGRTLHNIKEYWARDSTLHLFENDDMKMIHEGFCDLEEEWSTIDVDALRHIILQKTVQVHT